jgi:hypothetical protein
LYALSVFALAWIVPYDSAWRGWNAYGPSLLDVVAMYIWLGWVWVDYTHATG